MLILVIALFWRLEISVNESIMPGGTCRGCRFSIYYRKICNILQKSSLFYLKDLVHNHAVLKFDCSWTPAMWILMEKQTAILRFLGALISLSINTKATCLTFITSYKIWTQWKWIFSLPSPFSLSSVFFPHHSGG